MLTDRIHGAASVARWAKGMLTARVAMGQCQWEDRGGRVSRVDKNTAISPQYYICQLVMIY